jgi:hypothetical protein
VIVVGVRADDGQHSPVTDGRGDRFGVVRRVNDDHLALVTDQPDVVVHRPRAAVKAEGPRRDHPLNHELVAA